MTPALPVADLEAGTGTRPFRRVLCGLDASPASREAARQAAILGDDVDLVTVVDDWSGDQRVSPGARQLRGHPPAAALMSDAGGHDLIAVGGQSRLRVAAMVTGSTATALLRGSPKPVLIARTPPEERAFPGRVMVAIGGRTDPAPAMAVGAKLATLPDTKVLVVHVTNGHVASRQALARAFAAYKELTDAEPVELLVHGDPVETLLVTAERQQASLIVTGSRGLTGLLALASVSERVAHRAGCSVLVVRDA